MTKTKSTPYPGTPERRARLKAATGYCWATYRAIAADQGKRACDLPDDELVALAVAYRAAKADYRGKGAPRRPAGPRRTKATIERICAQTGYAWHTVYRVAAARQRSVARMSDAEIIAMMSWHSVRCAGAVSSRARRSLRRVRCEYCGRMSAEVGRTWRYDYDEDAITCARGEGCSRRRPENEREARCHRGQRTREYRDLHGHWWTIQQIADVADISRAAAYQRMIAGWTVEDATRPRLHSHGRPQYHTRLRRALTQALQEAV